MEAESLEKLVPFFDLRPAAGINPEDFARLSGKELKYARNYAYAVRGFPFKDAELRNFYRQFFWYRPNSKATAQKLRLSPAEAAFIAQVKRSEAKRSG